MNHQLAVREQVSDVLPIATQGITREQSRAIPEGVRNEWIAGTLYLHANPTFPHQYAVDQLRIELALQYDRDQSGSRRWWFVSGPNIASPESDLIPDIAGWRIETMAQMPTTLSTEVTPDWICEVLSPSTARHDRGVKFDHYARLGVGYYWIVDLARQRIETWANEGSGWVHGPCAENDETVFLPPFEDMRLSVGRLWIDPAT